MTGVQTCALPIYDYAVLDGVKPGDKVVVSGTQFLVDGVPVIPQG